MLAWRLCAITLLATLVAACGTGGEGERQPVSTDINRGSTTTISTSPSLCPCRTRL